MQDNRIFTINKLPKQKEQATKLSSHFLGLECVLDKYQHQNQILSQKVSFLIQENKRLRLGSSYNHSGDYIKYQKAINKCKDNNQYHLRNTTHTNTLQLKNMLTKLHEQTYHLNVYDFQKDVSGRSKVVVQNTRRLCNKYSNNNNNDKENQVAQIYKKYTNSNKSNIDSGRKCQLSLQKYSNKKDTSNSPTNQDEKQTQRYSNQNTNTNPRIRIKTQPIIISNTTNSRQFTSKQSYRQATQQQSHKQSNRQSNLQSNRSSNNKQINRQINRQAYLQDQTIFLDSQDISIQDNRQPQKQKNFKSSKNYNNIINNGNTNTNTNKTKQIDYQKLPIFIQASFGNLDDKQQQQIYQHQYDNNNLNNNNNFIKKNKTTQFSIQSLQKQLKQKSKPNDIHKSNFRLGKTQQQKKSYAKTTYLISDKLAQNYRYSEQFDKDKLQDKENIQLISGKKTNSPYIKSDYKLIEPKTQLSKIFHPERKREDSKCQNKPQVVCKMKQNIGQPSCMGVKKTFINVMSRKPRINIFQK